MLATCQPRYLSVILLGDRIVPLVFLKQTQILKMKDESFKNLKKRKRKKEKCF